MGFLELISDEGFRLDGRRPTELRNITGKLGILSDLDGSCYFEQGNTKVLVTVSGPREIKKRTDDQSSGDCQLEIHWNMTTFATPERSKKSSTSLSLNRRPIFSTKDRKIADWISSLKESLEEALLIHLMPNTQIDIHVNILEADGSILACVINAVTLALIHAGIPMIDFLCACTVGIINETILLDTNHIEELSSSVPVITLAILPRSRTVTLLHLHSKIPIDKFNIVLEAAISGAVQIHSLLADTLKNKKVTSPTS